MNADSLSELDSAFESIQTSVRTAAKITESVFPGDAT
jgi:hypothetical protein